MKSILTSVMVLVVGVFCVSAQADDHQMKRKDLKKEFYQSLSEDQKTEFDSYKKLREEQKSVLEATFTKTQLAIVEDKEISKRGKKKALASTLNDEQREIRKKHRSVRKAKKEKFKASLSEEQQKKYDQLHQKRGKKGHKKDH